MNKIIITIILVSLIFVSCQKQLSFDPETTTNEIVINDSTLLSMYVVIDTTAPANLDTVSKSIFRYDNLKRLIKYEYWGYNNGIITTPTQGLRLWNSYFYNSTDTFPRMEIDSVNENTSVNRSIIYYTYANGKLITDSTIRLANFTEVHKYYYSPNKVVDTFTLYDRTTLPFTKSDYSYKNVYRQTPGNNVTSNIDSLYQNSSFTPPTIYTYFETRKTINSFDNNPNPFNKFSILDPFLNNYESIFEALPFSKQSKNNTTEFTLTITSATYNEVVHYQCSYQYRANGYPKILKATDLVDPTNSFKAYYYYTN